MKKLILLFCLANYGNIQTVNAQCSASGPLFGSIFSNDASVGNIAWSNPGNVSASDGSKASSAALIIGDETNYLVIKGFGFNITSPANICGIVVEVEGSASGLLQNVKDNSIKIIKGGVITGPNKAAASAWPGSDALETYGSNSDLWGTTWSVSDVNSSEFGVAISANLTSLSALPTANIDAVKVTVYYVSTLPIELTYFNAQRLEGGNVQLSWETETEMNSDYFSIERSIDAYNWYEIDRVKAVGNSTSSKHYNFIDVNSMDETTYYRLKQTDVDGMTELSNMVVVSPNVNFNEVVQLSPNPCKDELNIKVNSANKNASIETVIFEAESGREVERGELFSSKNNVINTSNLDPGVYFIMINDGYSINKKLKFIKSN